MKTNSLLRQKFIKINSFFFDILQTFILIISIFISLVLIKLNKTLIVRIYYNAITQLINNEVINHIDYEKIIELHLIRKSNKL